MSEDQNCLPENMDIAYMQKRFRNPKIQAIRCPGTEGCIHCGQQFKNLKIRFARLCAQYRERFSQANCTKFPWRMRSYQDLALDELSLDLLLEKTHRVFRVIEINQSLDDFPEYWNWLHEVKMPELSREVLCPPACQGATSAFNCSTCRRVDVPCWGLKTCYPDGTRLQKAVRLLSSISGSCLFLGLVSCALEFRLRPGIGTA
ncbi:sperm-egg fusion protein TMEM95 [Elgaria multicarinata webbii]|uniref:sperm-egg fusion protein TMEM95 n=1 Tax=Elgaria multicarinata webbii TaxID=159646 RepID=UPI002FCCD856